MAHGRCRERALWPANRARVIDCVGFGFWRVADAACLYRYRKYPIAARGSRPGGGEGERGKTGRDWSCAGRS